MVTGAVACAVLANAPSSLADEAEQAPSEPDVHVHGFVSQGYLRSTWNNYLAKSADGSFEFTEVGLNFTSFPTDELRVGVQLFARDLGPLGDYKPQVDWFYLDYRVADWLGIRAGRTKLPFGLYNELNDIDAARVPILLPQSVYPTESRDYLLAQTGGELYGTLPLGGAGRAEYRAYGGTIFLDTGGADEVKELTVPYLFGGRLMWQTPLDGFQLGGSIQALRLDLEYVPPPAVVQAAQAAGRVPANFDGDVSAKVPALLWVASIEYAANDVLLATEYSRWRVKVRSSLPALLPESETQSERYYAMASYRVNSWFTPGVYYSVLYPNVDDRNGRDAYQHDVALSFRYDLNPHWLFKVEGHYMHGTAGLRSDLNGGARLDTLRKDWGLLALKTTAYF